MVKALEQTVSNYPVWRGDQSSPTYSDGAMCTNPGPWQENVGIDEMFEDWGDPVAVGRSQAYIIG